MIPLILIVYLLCISCLPCVSNAPKYAHPLSIEVFPAQLQVIMPTHRWTYAKYM